MADDGLPVVELGPPGYKPMADLSPEERDHWRLTGNYPTPPTDSSVADADSTPAAPVAQAASTDASIPAASEPAASSTPPKTAARIQQLLADRATEKARADALEARLAALERPAPAAVAASAPAADTIPDFATWSAAHPDGTWDQWSQAHITQTARQETARLLAESRTQQTQAEAAQVRQALRQARVESFVKRRDAALAADPALVTKIAPLASLVPTELLNGQPRTSASDLAQEILIADEPIALMAHFADHPEDYQRILALPDPLAVTRAVALVAGRLTVPVSKGNPNRVSTAPAPPTTLGSKTAAPTDEVQAAVVAKDFRKYRQLMNAREVAAAQGR
jgi:hypothetical protein